MASSPSPNSVTQHDDTERMRKRARDRKAQQAMRDRARWTLQNLEQQVATLTHALEQEASHRGHINSKLQALENENEHLRVQNAALQLRLLRQPSGDGPLLASPTLQLPLSLPLPLPNVVPVPPWEVLPMNTPATCISDQILQDWLSSNRRTSVSSEILTLQKSARSKKPDLCSLLNKDQRSDDETSNVVGDIIRSYNEIEPLPRKTAVHFLMVLLFKWLLLQDEQSWNCLPVWLRPEAEQVTTPHPAWIDRIPWPKARSFLIRHPEINFDEFAGVYSISFDVHWDYDPSHVLNTGSSDADGLRAVFINPIFEEHVRNIRNWSVGKAFRVRFPDLARSIDASIAESP